MHNESTYSQKIEIFDDVILDRVRIVCLKWLISAKNKLLIGA